MQRPPLREKNGRENGDMPGKWSENQNALEKTGSKDKKTGTTLGCLFLI
jgi:hypothetical protein